MAISKALAVKSFIVILSINLIIEAVIFLFGFIPTPSSPFSISFWVIQDLGDSYSLWSWISTPSTKAIRYSLKMLTLSVGVHFLLLLLLSILFLIKIKKFAETKHSPQTHSILSIFLRGIFFITLLLSFVPLVVYELVVLKAIEGNRGTQGIHQGPAFSLWCIAVALQISAVYLVIRITSPFSSTDDDESGFGEIKISAAS